MSKKLIDFYELTMAQVDLSNGFENQWQCFDLYFRNDRREGVEQKGYSISAGLSEIIDYIQNISFSEEELDYLKNNTDLSGKFLKYLRTFKFTGDIYAIPDGTPIFPGEPILTVWAPAPQAKIIETDVLNRFNHACAIATKSKRIVDAAHGRSVMEFGARRAQGDTAAINGAKYAYIAGCTGTSCYGTGLSYNVPLLGTMAHSLVTQFPTEYEAFLAYAREFPNNTVLLVDTYDTLQSGIPNAIRVAKEFLEPMGKRLKGVRLDSGDLAYLSKEARRMLDSEGLNDCKIIASNSLDEYTIENMLLKEEAMIDSFGVGENLITSKASPVFGGVYKLVATSDSENGRVKPKIKVSDDPAKTTVPGRKSLYRFYDKDSGFALGDLVALADEEIPADNYRLVDHTDPSKYKDLSNYVLRELQVPIFKKGKLVYTVPSIEERREYCRKEFETIYPEIKRFLNPHIYYVDLSVKLAKLKNYMSVKQREKNEKRKAI